MEAVVFAAGRGTRLGELTRDVPKALLDVGGRPMLEHVLRRLAAAGVRRAVVTACHHAEEVERFVAARRDLGLEVVVSTEPGGPYETGGGLLRAAPLLREEGPLLVHNADVLTDLSLPALLAAHGAGGALATLAVLDRPASRRLLFDADGLVGRRDEGTGEERRARPARGPVEALGFLGVQAVSRGLLPRIRERGTFSLVDVYLRLAGEGARLLPWRAEGALWIDVGRPEDLERARRAVTGRGPP